MQRLGNHTHTRYKINIISVPQRATPRATLISYLILLTLSLINANVKLYADDTMQYSAHSNPNVLEITE